MSDLLTPTEATRLDPETTWSATGTTVTGVGDGYHVGITSLGFALLVGDTRSYTGPADSLDDAIRQARAIRMLVMGVADV